MSGPLVSIVVPVYAVEDYLDECLAGIAAQTYSKIEIILVDDGSPDRCGEICDEFAERDERAIVIHRPNGGLSAARNTGFEAARGEYICFVDSDDRIRSGYVEGLLRAAIGSGAEIAVCGLVRFEADEHRTTAIEVAPKEGPGIMSGREATRFLMGQGQVLMTMAWNKLFHASLFAGGLRFRGRILEDEDFAYRVLSRAVSVAFVPAVLYEYRVRPGSIMTSGWSERNLAVLEIYRERAEYLATLDDDGPARADDHALARLATQKYLGALLRANSDVHLSGIATRDHWLEHIHAELNRISAPSALRGIRPYDAGLLSVYRLNPVWAAHAQRRLSQIRGSAIGMRLFRSKTGRPLRAQRR
ncbi:MAG TPA: glycosyltransferase family 2 protein [Actinomycetaceae bacterium]|nr:glycosyltransferase family 2 protein [Actinomycetaceae bacterium]